MTISDSEREATAIAQLDIAAKWREKGNPRRELTVLTSAAKSLLGVSVTRFNNAEEGITYLRSRDVAEAVQRIAELNQQLYESFMQGATAAVNNQITPVHIAWLVDEWEAAEQLIRICRDPKIAESFPQTAFWAEFIRAIEFLRSGQEYQPRLPKVRGYEKRWAVYLSLISDITNGRDMSSAESRVADEFEKRNQDKRLTDWEMIDGDGEHPVQWDFRAVSIRKYVEYADQTSG